MAAVSVGFLFYYTENKQVIQFPNGVWNGRGMTQSRNCNNYQAMAWQFVVSRLLLLAHFRIANCHNVNMSNALFHFM